MGDQELNFTNGEIKEEAIEPEEGMPIISIPSKDRFLEIEKEIDRLEKNIEFYNRIKTVSLKLTKPSDWIDQGGNPYLMDRGAENVAIAWGVDISDIKLKQEWAEDENGRYYAFIASGKAYSKKLGRYVEDIGVCSQRDRFFGMTKGGLKPIEEVDMANIRRKAVTNLYTRLIKRVIGLMNVTFDDLKIAGIDITKISKIEYRGGTQKIEATEADKKKQKELWDLLLQYTGGADEVARDVLKKQSSFEAKDGKSVEGKDDVKYLTGKWLNFTLKKIKGLVSEEREPGEEG